MPNEYEPIKQWVRDTITPAQGDALVPAEESILDPIIETPKEEPKVEVPAPVVDPKVEELKKKEEESAKGVADALIPTQTVVPVPTPIQERI